MNCKNCKKELLEDSSYCNKCGARIIRNRLTFGNLFSHLSETFFNYDNKLLRTFIDLFKKPEVVIGGYINGVRKHYVNPISFFGLTLTVIGLEWLILQKFFPNLMNMSSISLNGDETFFEGFIELFQKYSSIIMMLFVPIYAIISRIVFFDNKKYNYTEHIAAFTYMLAVISLIGAILNITCVLLGYDIGAVTYINSLIQVLYISYCFKRLYKLNMAEIVGRTFLSFVVYMVLYIIIVIMVLVVIYSIEGKEAILNIFKSLAPQ